MTKNENVHDQKQDWKVNNLRYYKQLFLNFLFRATLNVICTFA